MIRTSNLSALGLLRPIEYCDTSAPIIWRWLVWTNTQGFTAGLPALEAEMGCRLISDRRPGSQPESTPVVHAVPDERLQG
jgi:hypothetical protein